MKIPKEAKFAIEQLKKQGYQAYLVGGCVRDFLREVSPHDWDIATNAEPKKIQKIFPKSFLENKFGTVTILTKSNIQSLKAIEITPFRIEGEYSDKRHPDEVKWAQTIQEDLSRRDFTINAMAIDLTFLTKKELSLKIIDPFRGRKDLQARVIRAVGDAQKRFAEDALRLMRAIRFSVTLSPEKIWEIEPKTKSAIQKNAQSLSFVSKERIRDELLKILKSPNAAQGIEYLRRLKLLKYIIPELEEGFGIEQNKHHVYQIYTHNLLSLDYACRQNFSLAVRIAALLHDVGKPRTKRGEGPDSTFYNHEIVGAKMTEKILQRLRFPKKEIEKIVKLVRFHLFYYNVGEVGKSSVRKLLRRVGQENISELLQLRMCDRIGSGVPKAEPYKLRHLRYVMEKVSQDPISAKMLAVNGKDVMKIVNVPPCPKVGQILTYLLSEVLSEPKKNTKQFLENEIKKIKAMSDKTIEKMADEARKKIEQIEQKKDAMTKKKYWII